MSKWFAQFCAGDFSLDDAPQSGRQMEVDSDQIETVTDDNQCSITYETADTLRTSKSIVIGENGKCVFYFMEENIPTSEQTQYFPRHSSHWFTQHPMR